MRPDLAQQPQLIPELTTRNRVNSGRRLVEKEDVGAMNERARKRELLFHAA